MVTQEQIKQIREYLKKNTDIPAGRVEIGGQRVEFVKDATRFAYLSAFYFDNNVPFANGIIPEIVQQTQGGSVVHVLVGTVKINHATLDDIEHMFAPYNNVENADAIVPASCKYELYEVTARLANFVLMADIHFEHCHFTSTCKLPVAVADGASITFEKCIFANDVHIYNGVADSREGFPHNIINLNKLEFTDCTIAVTAKEYRPLLQISHMQAQKFVLNDLHIPKEAQVSIGDCDFHNFTLSNIHNSGKLKIHNLNATAGGGTSGTLQINKSTIGDADFQNLNFVSYKKREIYDNILAGIQYSNVRWEQPKGPDIQVGDCDPDNNAEVVAKTRDTYRVLKNVAQTNNDQPQAFAFYAKEMKYHCNLINENKKGNWQEWIILAFNRWTSNFGQSWGLPIFWIVFLGGLFYAFLLDSFIGPYNPELWSKFWVFLNPTHKTEFVAEERWNGYSYFIDALFRVLEGGLIYQAIQAFRRHSRKF